MLLPVNGVMALELIADALSFLLQRDAYNNPGTSRCQAERSKSHKSNLPSKDLARLMHFRSVAISVLLSAIHMRLPELGNLNARNVVHDFLS